MSSIVNGYIHCFRSEPDVEAHNRRVLEGLGDTGSLLVRPMLSLLPNHHGHSYYGHLLHFAAYYKEFWDLDEEWIVAYESLLEARVWDSSEVMHQWTSGRTVWESQGSLQIESISGMKVVARKRFLHDLAAGAT
ncbi:hypothetical protein [Xanthomonas pisi]|uniref:Uncharacterized protein n=1 Tax=Xanthomonas pisi TaxID=56457 RepID=A0A2S7D4I3_9XANT|nr:hypothetical protein [Xanthomonas pisi]PPU68751.1 hypothetical protein XpiCFBP4643_09685 [Xanthomonas pisi]